MQLGLEEVQQVEADAEAKGEENAPAERHKCVANRGDLPAHLPRIGKRWSTLQTRSVPAAPVSYIVSAKTSPSDSTSCRPSSGFCSCVDQNTPVEPAKTSWCKHRHRHRRG
jgi:hypothetical protein